MEEFLRAEMKSMEADASSVPGSFAAATSRGVPPIKVNGVSRNPAAGRATNNTMIFYPPEVEGEATMTAEQTGEGVEKLVDPRTEGWQIQRLRGVAKSGYLLQVSTAEAKGRILANKKLKSSRLRVVEPGRALQKVMLYDTPKDMDRRELMSTIWAQNLRKDLSEDEVLKEIKIVKTIPAKEALEHLVMEVTPRMRSLLMRTGRVYIDYDSCRIKHFLDVTRCYRCQEYGHVAKYCKDKTTICSHCTGPHDYKDCRNREQPETFGACKRINKDAAHSVNSRTCPVYLRAAELSVTRTQYE